MRWLSFEYDGEQREGQFIKIKVSKQCRPYVLMRVPDLDTKEMILNSFHADKMVNVISTER